MLDKLRIFVFLSLSIFSSCRSQDFLYKTQGFVSPTEEIWDTDEISVCFENPGDEIDKQTVKAAITREYSNKGKVFHINFLNWSDCTVEDTKGIRVVFDNKSVISKTLAFGKKISGIKGGISLSLVEDCPVSFTGSRCQENTAIHEFGHALGLHHEMNRKDNSDCLFEQLNEPGDINAVQIGDFDQESVMNYCALLRASANNRHLVLSNGDLQNLYTLYHEPVAKIVDPPLQPISLMDFNLKVTGKNVHKFRYQIGLSENIDCKLKDGYSDPLDIDFALSNLAVESLPQGRTVKLCIIGGNLLDHWQNTVSYSSILIGILNLDDRNPPVLKSIDLSYQKDNPKYLILELDSEDESEVSNFSVNFAYLEIPYIPKIGYLKTFFQANSRRIIQFPLDLFEANGTIFLKSVVVNDLNGNTVTWQTNLETKELQPGILSPTLHLSNKSDFEKNVPVFSRLAISRQVTSHSDQLTFSIGLIEESAVANIRIKLEEVDSGKTKIIYGSKVSIARRDISNYSLAADISSWPSSGAKTYRVQSVDVFDLFGNKGGLTSSTRTQEFFDATSIAVPRFVLDKL